MHTAAELRLVHVLLAIFLFVVSCFFVVAGIGVMATGWGSQAFFVGLAIIGIGAIFAGGGWMCVRCAQKKEHT
jgi:hypothetical protein